VAVKRESLHLVSSVDTLSVHATYLTKCNNDNNNNNHHLASRVLSCVAGYFAGSLRYIVPMLAFLPPLWRRFTHAQIARGLLCSHYFVRATS